LLVHQPVAPETVLTDLPAGSHLLVLTHDHAEDLAICDAALRRPGWGSIGLIGSAAKWARFRLRLQQEGHSAAAVDRIRCPIGMPAIAGKEPAVIAVSVTAELISSAQNRLGAADVTASVDPDAEGLFRAAPSP
jgi:xanthine dehydrogenase accessory factor